MTVNFGPSAIHSSSVGGEQLKYSAVKLAFMALYTLVSRNQVVILSLTGCSLSFKPFLNVTVFHKFPT